MIDSKKFVSDYREMKKNMQKKKAPIDVEKYVQKKKATQAKIMSTLPPIAGAQSTIGQSLEEEDTQRKDITNSDGKADQQMRSHHNEGFGAAASSPKKDSEIN